MAVWDRLFGTHIDQSPDGREAMTIGAQQYRDVKQVALLFVGKVTGYAINRCERNQTKG